MNKKKKKIISLACFFIMLLSSESISSVLTKIEDNNSIINGIDVETKYTDASCKPNYIDYLFNLQNKIKINNNTINYDYLLDFDYADPKIINKTAEIATVVDYKKIVNTNDYKIISFIKNNDIGIKMPNGLKLYRSLNNLKDYSNYYIEVFKLATNENKVYYILKEKIKLKNNINLYNKNYSSKYYNIKNNQVSEILSYNKYNNKLKSSLFMNSYKPDKSKENVVCKYYEVPYLEKNDELISATAFKFENDNITVLSHVQNGVLSKDLDVIENNIGDTNKFITNIDNTLFNQLENEVQDKDYVCEALDRYSFTDNYNVLNNKEEFEKFIDYKK